nr:hypothetical protein [Actinomycetota bacterium]
PSADDSLRDMSTRPALIVLLAMIFGGSVLLATSMIGAPESEEVPVVELEVLTEEDRERATEIGDEARDRSEERRERRPEPEEEEARDPSPRREDAPDRRDPSGPQTGRSSPDPQRSPDGGGSAPQAAPAPAPAPPPPPPDDDDDDDPDDEVESDDGDDVGDDE